MFHCIDLKRLGNLLRSGWPATTVLMVAVLATLSRPAHADVGIGWVGLTQTERIDLGFGAAKRTLPSTPAFEGVQVYASIEGGHFMKPTVLGGLGGIEYRLAFGYDGATSNPNTVATFGTAALMNLEAGFPVVLLHYVTRRPVFLVGIAPGVGIDGLNAYLYLKAKGAWSPIEPLTAELQWQWNPGPTSAAVDGGSFAGLNQASVRGTLFLNGKDRHLHAFGEYRWSQREELKEGSNNQHWYGGLNPFKQTTRSHFESTTLGGVGIDF